MYKELVKVSFKEIYSFRNEFLLDFFRFPLTNLVYLLVYYILYQNNSTVFGLSTKEGMTYILFTSYIATTFSASHIARLIYSEIESGYLINKLTRPSPYFMMYYVPQVPVIVLNTLIFLGNYLLIILLFPDYFLIINGLKLLVFLIFSFMAYTCTFQIYYFIGILSFWIKDNSYVSSLYGVLSTIFGGRYFPIAAIPLFLTLQKLLLIFPFALLFNIPGNFIISKLTYTGIFYYAVLLLFYLVLFKIGNARLWQLGEKNFEAFGN